MRRVLIGGLLAVLALGVAGLGLAASATVSMTGTGPQPSSVTVEWGETVTFSNADSVAHGVAFPRLNLTSPSIPPSGTFEQAFAVRAGNYAFRQTGGERFTGSVSVRVSGSLALKASRSSITYGQTVTISGRSTQPGAVVTIKRKTVGSSEEWVTQATVQPQGDAFSIRVKPAAATQFQAFAAGDQLRSSRVLVSVAPRIVLRKPRVSRGRVTVVGRVFPARAARRAVLERSVPPRSGWRAVADRKVSSTGVVTLGWKLEPGRSRLRIALRRSDLAPGYEATESRWALVIGPPAPPR